MRARDAEVIAEAEVNYYVLEEKKEVLNKRASYNTSVLTERLLIIIVTHSDTDPKFIYGIKGAKNFLNVCGAVSSCLNRFLYTR